MSSASRVAARSARSNARTSALRTDRRGRVGDVAGGHERQSRSLRGAAHHLEPAERRGTMTGMQRPRHAVDRADVGPPAAHRLHARGVGAGLDGAREEPPASRDRSDRRSKRVVPGLGIARVECAHCPAQLFQGGDATRLARHHDARVEGAFAAGRGVVRGRDHPQHVAKRRRRRIAARLREQQPLPAPCVVAIGRTLERVRHAGDAALAQLLGDRGPEPVGPLADLVQVVHRQARPQNHDSPRRSPVQDCRVRVARTDSRDGSGQVANSGRPISCRTARSACVEQVYGTWSFGGDGPGGAPASEPGTVEDRFRRLPMSNLLRHKSLDYPSRPRGVRLRWTSPLPPARRHPPHDSGGDSSWRENENIPD